MELKLLGDQAILATFPEEAMAMKFAAVLRSEPPCWLDEVVPAYLTVAVFHQRGKIALAEVQQYLRDLQVPESSASVGMLHRIPCCYEMQQDLHRIAEHTRRSPEEVISLHSGREYTVFAIGFCPGFPYLGYLPPELTGVPRLASPRLRVEPGSVGLTGRQTGVYPLARPGGWNLLGRTPRVLVDVADDYFPIQVGDRVIFERIDQEEFRRQQGQRLWEG